MGKDPLEILWDGLLSRRPKRIIKTYNNLDAASQIEVLRHLQRMANEDGWHPEQVKSALAALSALNKPAASGD